MKVFRGVLNSVGARRVSDSASLGQPVITRVGVRVCESERGRLGGGPGKVTPSSCVTAHRLVQAKTKTKGGLS